MATLTTDQARELLGGLNGHDLLAGHANRDGICWSPTARLLAPGAAGGAAAGGARRGRG